MFSSANLIEGDERSVERMSLSYVPAAPQLSDNKYGTTAAI